MGSHEALPDAILELVLLGLDSAPCLLRAAATCKRWRRIITSDAFCSLHKTPPLVAGFYSNSYHKIFVRPRFKPSPSAAAIDAGSFFLHKRLPSVAGFFSNSNQTIFVRPRFEPSPSAAIDAGRFSLDFLPGYDATTNNWTIKDSRSSLLLLYREDSQTGHQDLFVCEPLTRRHVLIPPLNPPFRLSRFGSPAPPPVLLDASADGGAIVGMSSFRVLHLVATTDRIRACTFTSGSTSWRETCVNRRYGPLVLHFVGFAGGRWYWHDGEKNVLALDESDLEFSTSVLPRGDGDGISLVTLAVGRDGEARIVSKGYNNLKIFARVDGGEDYWVLEKTMQLSAAMLGLPRLDDFYLNFSRHQPVDAGAVQIRVLEPGRALRFRLDMDTMEAERLLGPDVIIYLDSRTAYPSEFPWPLSLHACCGDDNT
ncbi:unnamed protein product [Urochloa decumbens]|uniref:F-box domain-containing protein n=1 Tax=Urochloa decumbens TaxID=240449 RepID=A0ABC9GBT1_9POAL